MSKQVALAASGRAGLGKGEARALRRAGRVPGVAYGADLEQAIPVSVDGRELYHALHTDAGTNAILRLDIDGADTQLAIVREIQRHPVRREVTHVDFVTVNRNVKISVDIPIVIEGEPPAPTRAASPTRCCSPWRSRSSRSRCRTRSPSTSPTCRSAT
jgi:large subunit ribosomal protein L25